MSLPEVLLWAQLRGQRLGLKFRKQHPLGPYKADFCCLSVRLVVEVDGAAHDRGDTPQRDDRRDEYMKAQGFRVIRVAAVDVLNNMEGVLQLIAREAANPLHRPTDGPPPRAGEDSK